MGPGTGRTRDADLVTGGLILRQAQDERFRAPLTAGSAVGASGGEGLALLLGFAGRVRLVGSPRAHVVAVAWS